MNQLKTRLSKFKNCYQEQAIEDHGPIDCFLRIDSHNLSKESDLWHLLKAKMAHGLVKLSTYREQINYKCTCLK